jgi:class 3 adenylate cyclase
VRDHFTVLRQAAAAHNGTVVKTIGDAVMAAFFDAPAALAAAFEMVAAFDVWVATVGLEHPPALKVGVHVGSALVVHSDQAGLDYFGGTVNLAARAQGAAEAGEIVWTDAVQSMERAREVVAAQGFVAAPMSKTLKGLGEVRLWRNVREIPKKDVE